MTDEQTTMTWQPIETAPKDGREVLVIHRGVRRIARWASVWHRDNQMWVADNPLSDPPTVAGLGPELPETDPFHRPGPTHWMPLPQPPEEGDTQ